MANKVANDSSDLDRRIAAVLKRFGILPSPKLVEALEEMVIKYYGEK